MLTPITTNISIRSCIPEVCRGRNPPTILWGITHSNTHSGQKKTRNGYDNCSANSTNNLNIRIMRPRSERVAEFMANIDNLPIDRLQAACNVRHSYLPDLNDMTAVINKLKEEFAEKPESWLIDDVADEYGRIANMSDRNLQIWINYRRNCNADVPIAKANGNFIEVKAEGIKVKIDGASVNIDNNDFVTIYSDCGDGEDYWANVSYAAMQKIVQIKDHWNEIKRLVE